MPLRSALTPAIRVAPWLERGLALVALLGCLAAVLAGIRQSHAAASAHRIALQRRDPRGASIASGAIKHAIKTEKEPPVEPTDAPGDGPEREGRGGTDLRHARTDSSDHPDLQRVGEPRPSQQTSETRSL